MNIRKKGVVIRNTRSLEKVSVHFSISLLLHVLIKHKQLSLFEERSFIVT